MEILLSCFHLRFSAIRRVGIAIRRIPPLEENTALPKTRHGSLASRHRSSKSIRRARTTWALFIRSRSFWFFVTPETLITKKNLSGSQSAKLSVIVLDDLSGVPKTSSRSLSQLPDPHLAPRLLCKGVECLSHTRLRSPNRVERKKVEGSATGPTESSSVRPPESSFH